MTTERNCFVDGQKESISATEANGTVTVTSGELKKTYPAQDAPDLNWAIDLFIRWLKFQDEKPITVRYDVGKANEAGVISHPEHTFWAAGIRTGKYEYDEETNTAMIEVRNLPDPALDYVTVVDSFDFTEN